MSRAYLGLLCALVFASITAHATEASETLIIKAAAKNKFERTKIAEAGFAIDGITSDGVTIFGSESDAAKLKAMGFTIETASLSLMDTPFPSGDGEFHDYQQVRDALKEIVEKNPDIAQPIVIGKSLEGRELAGVRLSSKAEKDSLPTAIFMGCHHAREHLSVEVPLKLAQYIAERHATDSRIQQMLSTTEIYIIPMINPDGAEYDISSGKYKYWRKNRRQNSDGTFGVDLNRNYGPAKFFGGPGSSSTPSSDTYHGTGEFSEPETAAVRDFVRARKKATTLLTFHTFSELVLWPYGSTYDPISNETDRKVYETLGNKMASWNHYTPEKSSDLYLASGDTTDWAYEELKLFAFTFELSPSSMFGGGFYPGAKAIEPTFEANLEPALYLIENTPNPYGVLDRSDDLSAIH